jgi:hypothetical protein
MDITVPTRVVLTALTREALTALIREALTALIRVDITALIFMVAVFTQAVITTATITGQVITPMTVRFLSASSRSRLPHFPFRFFQFRYRAIDKPSRLSPQATPAVFIPLQRFFIIQHLLPF